MKHDVSDLRQADGVRPNPSQTIMAEMQQEWFRNLLLCSVLFFILCLMAVFMYLGTFGDIINDHPDTRHISSDGPAYVVIERMTDFELN